MSQSIRTQLRDELAHGADHVLETPLTLLVAPGGYGKTTVARAWRGRIRSDGIPVAWLDLTPAHAEPRAFLEDWVESLRAALPARPAEQPAFGESVSRVLSQGTELQPDGLARELARELRTLPAPPVIVLDGFESPGREGFVGALVDAMLRMEPCPVRLVVTTRGVRPASTARLLGEDRAVLLRAEDLSLRSAQVDAMLEDAGISPEPELTSALLARSEGWAIAVRLTIRALAGIPAEEHLDFVRRTGAREDLFEYIATELVSRVPAEVVSVLETAALMGATRRDVLAAASPVARAPARVDEALDTGLLGSDDERLAVHDLWRDWLLERARSRDDEPVVLAAHERAARALDDAGELERALDHYRPAVGLPGVEKRIVEILGDRGDLWLSTGNRRVVEESLAVLDPEVRTTRTALVALDGLLLSGRDPEQAILHLKNAARAYQEAGNTRAEWMCLHELAIVAINENRVGEVMEIYRRALSLRKVVMEPTFRGFVVMALGHGAMVTGRYRAALRIHAISQTYDHHPRERGGIGIAQSQISIQMGRWEEAAQRLQVLLSRPEQREHGISYHDLAVYQAIIDSARGANPDDVRRRLQAAVDTFLATRNTLSHLRALCALGRHEQRQGRYAEAATAFEGASALATRTEFWEAESAISGALARALYRMNDREGALEAARRAVDVLEAPDAWSTNSGRRLGWSPGIALACAVLSDLGEADRAKRFLEKNRARLEQPELPLAQHALLTFVARSLAGDDAQVKQALKEAWRAAEKARLTLFAPELDDDLLAWSAREARALGLEGASLERCAERFGQTARSPLRLQSFGGLAVEIDGQRARDRAWRGAIQRRLLMRLLCAEGRPVQREILFADLWPDMPTSRASNNLRVALSRLRDVVEPRRVRGRRPDVLDLDAGAVALTPAAIEAWDVTEWRTALAKIGESTREEDEAGVLAAAEHFAALGAAPLLPESYDDWVLELRRSLENASIETTREAAGTWLDRGRPEAARKLARIALAHDRADEHGWEIVVESHLAEGDRAGAARAFEEARDALLRELEAEPGPTLRALVADG